MNLYNSKNLATRLGFSQWKLAMMKRAGFQMSHGMMSTEAAAKEWLAAHPDFRTTTAAVALPPLQPQKRRRRATADTACG